jgi:hypothetical protein
MDNHRAYAVNWYGGATAIIDLYGGKGRRSRAYQRRYIPAFRATIRPPWDDVSFGDNIRGPIDAELEAFSSFLAKVDAQRRSKAEELGEMDAAPEEAMQALRSAGNALFRVTFPSHARADLRPPNMFVEVGMDEDLVGYPWELMHDGKDFLCLKHYVGRFVNAKKEVSAANQLEVRLWEEPVSRLAALLIVAHCPVRGKSNVQYEELKHAREEALAIEGVLNNAGVDVTAVGLREEETPAKYAEVLKKLEARRYHLIHFTGHAHFDAKNPRESSLVLQDRDIAASYIKNLLMEHRPILCFINACETARQFGPRQSGINVYSLARTFLDTGAYLLGSQWQVDDNAAKTFATTFYKALLTDYKPIGQAVAESRVACKDVAGDKVFSWASYVYYGDPHLGFVPEGGVVPRRATLHPHGAEQNLGAAKQFEVDPPRKPRKRRNRGRE